MSEFTDCLPQLILYLITTCKDIVNDRVKSSTNQRHKIIYRSIPEIPFFLFENKNDILPELSIGTIERIWSKYQINNYLMKVLTVVFLNNIQCFTLKYPFSSNSFEQLIKALFFLTNILIVR